MHLKIDFPDNAFCTSYMHHAVLRHDTFSKLHAQSLFWAAFAVVVVVGSLVRHHVYAKASWTKMYGYSPNVFVSFDGIESLATCLQVLANHPELAVRKTRGRIGFLPTNSDRPA